MRKHQANDSRQGAYLAVIVLVITAMGCGDEARIKPDPSFQKWQVKAETSKGTSPVSKKHAVAFSDRRESTTAEGEMSLPLTRPLPTQPITMSLKDTQVSTVLRALARAVDLNILVNEKVAAKTTINVKEARWDELFTALLRSNGLTYAWEGNLLRVMTLEDMEHELKRTSQDRDLRLAKPLKTNIIPIHYADEQKLKGSLEKFLSIGKDGKSIGSIMVDEHTRALIIQAVEDDMEQLMGLIDQLDHPIPQVLIEANIIEAGREVARELGIQWGGLAVHKGTVNHYVTAGAKSSGVTGGTLNDPIKPTSGMAVNFPAALSGGTGMSIGYVAENVGGNILTVQLSALQKEGKLNILSSPSITSIDNQIAVIEAGTNVPFQTVSKEGNINIEWKEAVLKLEVKPNVIDESTVKLLIKTNKDELDFSNSVAGNPTIITKKAETSVVLMDGQTTVIGGLNKQTNQNTDTGVPWLQNIPLLGYLFRGQGSADKMEDILIFITPHILKEQAAREPAEPGASLTPAEKTDLPKVKDAEQPAEPPAHPPQAGLPESPSFTSFASRPSEPPAIIGRIAVGSGQTLWEMMQMVYGDYQPAHLQTLLRYNPHIRTPERLQIGQMINFPAIPAMARSGAAARSWIKIAHFGTLAEALQYLQRYSPADPPVRLLPYWNESEGPGFEILLQDHFPDAEAAQAEIERLPPELSAQALVKSGWGAGTLFYADPYKSN